MKYRQMGKSGVNLGYPNVFQANTPTDGEIYYGENMTRINTKIFYMIVSEDTADLKKDGVKSTLIFSPFIYREMPLPDKLLFVLSVGIEFDPNEEMEIKICSPKGEVISTIPVGELLRNAALNEENYEFSDIISGNFSIRLVERDGITIDQEGDYRFVAEVNKVELFETKLSVFDSRGD
ncbi:hypothetical protein ACWGNU_14730 [Paenibacillus lautus]